MFKAIGNAQIDGLNLMALEVSKNIDDAFWSLSTGEQCYAALASNRHDLLAEIHFTIAEALARIGDEWTQALVTSWQHAGKPSQY